ncbi:hypothetical protein SS17_3332 [Escherichia coli O157:H7 str. SS17]|uniref:Uncharacterized protein n=1 Tax=Escherichia coli O157:H7 TaxID=83334 RepID=Q8X4G5_ECO57|nr:hypothetical protein Z3619 [Escherichia coli O157:H7 str. EDL933]ACT73080.1 predicted protein [Escherichia coli O157:H7 str. TW14359]AIF94881.1 hypothetical protein SS17_3332 [Escherichia coli O157:H7 str. SS17]
MFYHFKLTSTYPYRAINFYKYFFSKFDFYGWKSIKETSFFSKTLIFR